MKHDYWLAMIFLGAGMRCGWVIMAFWCMMAYAAAVGLICLFLKGCSISEEEEKVGKGAERGFEQALPKAENDGILKKGSNMGKSRKRPKPNQWRQD